jgi:hypothetical protein
MSQKKKTKRKPSEKLDTFFILETIEIEQEVPARSYEHALELYEQMRRDPRANLAVTTEGVTSTSSTQVEREVLSADEHLGEAE